MTLTKMVKHPHILIVDDDMLVQSLISRWLTKVGYSCRCAGSAVEAMSVMDVETFDLVTLDIRMPGESGLDLLQRIRHKYPEIAILMLTGQGDTQSAIRALTTGAFGYLQKPIQQAELLKQVAAALQQRESIIEDREYKETLTNVVREQSTTILEAHDITVQRLIRASLYRDEETGAHIRRTGEFSSLLALQIGWTQNEATRIAQAAPLHDIGKIGIPDSILRKAGPLTNEEMAIMRTHTIIGASMLADAHVPMLKMATEIALNHHERWDGRGYPHRVSGERIPEAARIVSIADVYDALTHDRVYRPAMPENEALAIMRNGRGQHFDPQLLDAFFDILPQIRYVNNTVHEEFQVIHPEPIDCVLD